MSDIFSRTMLIFGKDCMKKLKNSRVAVFGLGGVGSYAVEALARSGVGTLDLFDHDTICPTNINRQIYATIKTIGKYKADVAKERIQDINPDASVNIYKMFFTPANSHEVDFPKYDYITDAIDTISGKIELVMKSIEYGVPIISSMGAGNKVDPTKFEVADIYDTQICPIARVMRRELRKRGVERLKVVYSTEPPIATTANESESEDISAEVTHKRQIPGSTSFVPSVAGLIIAGEVIRDLINLR